MTLRAKQTRVEDFAIQNNTLVRDVADRVEDRISVEIGDSKSDEFIPQAKILRWDNETNFSIRRDNGARSFVERDGKIVAESRDENVVIYELEPDEQNEDGGLEVELELPHRPKTNVFEFTLQTKGLNFYYQPELTEKEKAEGASQPENVIGSYAAYHTTKRDNRVGGKHYRTGKAFHIYRPKAIDADGAEVWCELNIDEQAGVLTVTVPQQWLNRASYPVRVDPTFGYTSMGGTNASLFSINFGGMINFIRGSFFSLSESGDVSKITYGSGSKFDGDDRVSCAIYDESDDSFIQSTEIIVTPSGTAVWADLDFDVVESLTSGDYYLVAWGWHLDPSIHMSGAANIRYDSSGAIGISWRKDSDFGTWTDPFTGAPSLTTESRQYSIYATYEASGDPDPDPDPDPITKVKVAGTFVPIAPKVKISGTFVEKTSKVKVGGTFV